MMRLSRPRVLVARTAVLIIVATTVVSCDEETPENHYELKEVIDVQGTCAEDHVGRSDHYAGQIVRWRTVETGTISTYGFLEKPFSGENAFDEATHPTAYHTPLMMSFLNIDEDTSQPKWLLHGVSGGLDSRDGYASTCEVEVVKRGHGNP
jgi:hypothetical protein